MKKNIIIFAVALAILFSGQYILTRYNQSVPILRGHVTTEIKSIDEFVEYLSNNDEVYVYMGRPSCSDSDKFESYFKDMVKEYNIKDKIVFLNIEDHYRSSKKNDINYKEEIEERLGLLYTPTLAYYKDGVLIEKSEWTPADDYSKSRAENFLSKVGLK